MSFLDTHGGHLVCTKCGGLRSYDDTSWPVDRCGCTRGEHREERDMPCVVCGGCGLALRGGHTRWMVLFCGDCGPLLQDLRAMLGFPAPFGLHSIANGISLDASRLVRIRSTAPVRRLADRELDDFANDLNRHFDATTTLYRHVKDTVLARCERLGLVGEQLVEWRGYVTACEQAGIGADDGWRALLDSFGFSDWADDVIAYRHASADAES